MPYIHRIKHDPITTIIAPYYQSSRWRRIRPITSANTVSMYQENNLLHDHWSRWCSKLTNFMFLLILIVSTCWIVLMLTLKMLLIFATISHSHIHTMKKMVVNLVKCWASGYQPSSCSWWCWPAGLSSCWLRESSHQSWFSQLATPPLTLCWTSSSLLFVIIIISYGGQHRKLVGWKVGHTSVIGNWAQNNVVEGHNMKAMLKNEKSVKGVPGV